MATEFPTFVDVPEGSTPEPGTPDVDAAFLNGLTGALNIVENQLPAKANTADLATVATSGAYTDLVGAPFIPDSPDDIGAQPAGDYATTSQLAAKANAADLATVATSGAYADLTGKPSPYTDEQVRDVLGATLAAGDNVSIVPNDAGDTVTISATGGGGSGDYSAITLTASGVVATDTAAMDDAVTLALSSGRPIHMKAGTYRRETPWDCRGDNLTITTDGVLATKVEMQVDNVPILQVGHRWQRISSMSLYYVTAQPATNTSANAVEIYKSYLSFYEQFEVWGAARGVYIPQIDYAMGGDAVGNFAFSCRFADIWVMRYSDAALDLRGFNTNCTGCLFDNVYTNNDVGDGSQYTAVIGVRLQNWDEINIRQLNVEGVVLSSEVAVELNDVKSGNISNLHFERVTLTQWSGAMLNLYGDGSRMMIDGLAVVRCPFANVAGGQEDLLGIIKVGDGTQLWVNALTQHTNSPLTATERVLVMTNWDEYSGSVEIVGSDHESLVTAVEKQVGSAPASAIPVLKRINQDWRYYLEGGKAVVFGTAAPSTGTWARGDKCWNTAPTAAGAPGWVCTAAGAPGTWKAMANLAS